MTALEEARGMTDHSGPDSFLHVSLQPPGSAAGPAVRVCRLGLATRGDNPLHPADIELALERGINFFNWCGVADSLSRVIAGLGRRRRDVLVCVQFEARTAAEAQRELQHILQELRTDYVDILTFYYVEEAAEWQQIIGPGGALEFCRAAQKDGRMRWIGLTTHQRTLAAEAARSGLLDLLMIRYNAAHRGAETEVFPVTDKLGLPVVVYTCLRWGALLQPTPDDPVGYVPPRAPAWYRFALQSPSVAVALAAPANRAELEEDLTVLDAAEPLSPEEYEQLAAQGRRVRRHARYFP
jgi:predicted aldo/keto reductase-like oxidoreductase